MLSLSRSRITGLERFVGTTRSQPSSSAKFPDEVVRLKSGGNYIEFDELTLAGVQDPLGVSLDLYPNVYGIKVTIEKTIGTNRDYDYEVWFKER